MSYKANENRYAEMQYNRCGKSGLKLPAISLGLWQNFGEKSEEAQMKKIIYHAFDKGITHYDLANNYGPPGGEAEKNMGKLLSKGLGHYRDELIISTKAGYYMWPGPYGEWGSKKYLVSSLDQSLQRMGLDYVDIFYHHRPDPDTDLEETMGALHQIVKSGKALYAGLSNYTAEQTVAAIAVLGKLGTPCLIHQPRYSMFDRWVENGLLDVLGERGVGCIPFSPLAQGLLSDKYLKGIPKTSRVAKQLGNGALEENAITTEKLSKVYHLNEMAKQRGQSLAQMAIAWLLKDGRITSVLVGASSVRQIDENIEATRNTQFSMEELNQFNQILG